MSSVPPNPPPPPGGYPPYDPHTQWRVYREQQRAAWRAQRDAWKSQRYAWKAQYWKAYGPRVPSVVGPIVLVAIGVVWLLIYSGRIAAHDFWQWYGHWWPLILIGAGLALLGEWALDLRRQTPVRRGGSFVGILILVAFLGICAAAGNHMGIVGPWNWNGENGDFWNMFGQPEHDFDQPTINETIPANAAIDIENPRGDVSVSAGDGTNLAVTAHQVAYANSDSEAQKIFDAEKTWAKVSGTAVQVQSNSNDHGRVNLTVTVPATARVTVNAAHGDVTAAGLNTGITVTAAQGETRLSAINGPVVAHLSNSHHDFSAHQVTGDVTTDGNCGNLTLSEIKGRITTNGQIFGDVHIENVAGAIDIHTPYTNVQLASLPGDMTLNSDNLRVNEATGAVRVTTQDKDVDLSQIYGDTYVESRNGAISVEPAGAYAIKAQNNKGDVEITLPPNASGKVSGRTHNGDIVTDYALAISGEQDKTVTGRIGAGAAPIDLSTENGDLRIKKGPAFPATPVPPAVAGAPAPPPLNAKHLKAPKTPPPAPVVQ